MSRKGLVLSIGVACSVLLLALGCQQAAVPQPTPKPAEKAAAASPTKAPEKAAVAATKPAEKPVKGGTLRIATTSEFVSLDPNTFTGTDGFYSIYEQLIEPDKDANLTKNGLAKDWTVSGDGKSITFKLREGVKFQDGTAFDAAAVKFNVDRMKDPATKSPFQSYYESVTSAEVVDGLTVRLNFSQPDVLILPRLAGGAGGLMVSPAAVKKYGVDFPRNPVGTGPFQFVEWAAGDRITLKRFDGYWGKDKDGNQLPYLERVVFQFITDPTTAVANLRTGQADLIAGRTGVPLDQWPLIKKDPNLAFETRPAANHTGITMNTKRPPFDNKALRQAVALALDREGMGVFWGEGAIAYTSLFNPVDKAFDDGKSPVAPGRDLAKAKAKMAEAGYPSGGLKVKYVSTSVTTGVRVAEIVKANLAEIGIEVEIEAIGSAAWNARVRAAPWDYQLAATVTNIAVGDPGNFLQNIFHSKGSRNWFGPYSNPRVDEALDKALRTYDQKERAALYNEAAKLIIDDAPFVPVFLENGAAGMNKKVRNFVLVFDLFNRTRDVWLAP